MTDILSLSNLELRKEVAKAHGWSVNGVCGGLGYSLSHDGVSLDIYDTENDAWAAAPPIEFEIGRIFPLVLEMYEWGWDTTINCIRNTYGEKTLFVYCVNDDRATDFIEVQSDSSTDPSDAIAKCYLLVRREMGK